MEDIDLTDLYEQAKARSLFCSSPHHFVLTVNALREIILADREKRAQAAQGWISAEALSRMFESESNMDKTQAGFQWRKGWNDALRRAMDYCGPSPTEASKPVQAEAPISDLMKFYSVDNLSALVEAQARHIEKLQAKLPRNDQPAFTRIREG